MLALEAPEIECSNWYAVRTRSRYEKFVDNILQEKRIQSFLPVQDVLSQWKDRKKQIQKPLFPGYLFVRSLEWELDEVTATNGVAYILDDGDRPVSVPDEQIDAVRRLVESPDPIVQRPWLREGRRVHVTAGPLAGLEACVLKNRKNGKYQLVVSVDLLRQSVAVEIDPSCVEPIL